MSTPEHRHEVIAELVLLKGMIYQQHERCGVDRQFHDHNYFPLVRMSREMVKRNEHLHKAMQVCDVTFQNCD